MKEVTFARPGMPVLRSSLIACLATVLELEPGEVPRPRPDEDAATGWTISRWLGGRGLGIVAVARPAEFSWPGPWIARLGSPEAEAEARHVVMFGVPSGLVWDPAGGPPLERSSIEAGYVVAATDVALAMPPRFSLAAMTGRVESIWVAERAAAPARGVERAQALEGRGLEGDRHVLGTGTFPSGLPGSALTLIEAEVCRAFDPSLGPDEHRRNLVTAGIELNALVGRTFTIGQVRCRGMRLCEPCRVAQGYSGRPILRALVHRGGLRADIVVGGEIAVGDEIRVETS